MPPGIPGYGRSVSATAVNEVCALGQQIETLPVASTGEDVSVQAVLADDVRR